MPGWEVVEQPTIVLSLFWIDKIFGKNTKKYEICRVNSKFQKMLGEMCSTKLFRLSKYFILLTKCQVPSRKSSHSLLGIQQLIHLVGKFRKSDWYFANNILNRHLGKLITKYEDNRSKSDRNVAFKIVKFMKWIFKARTLQFIIGDLLVLRKQSFWPFSKVNSD